jgi:hypothetical protein
MSINPSWYVPPPELNPDAQYTTPNPPSIRDERTMRKTANLPVRQQFFDRASQEVPSYRGPQRSSDSSDPQGPDLY